MKNFRNNLFVIVIVLSLDEICAQSTVKLIPIPEALTFGPKTHERLTVPVEPTNNNLLPIPEALVVGPRTHERIIVPIEPVEKIIIKKPVQIQAPSGVKTVIENPILIKKNIKDVQIIQPKPIVLVNRYSSKTSKPVIVQKMQPLHITMKGLNQSKPNHTREDVHDRRQRFKAQEERIKMENLPPNPEEVPRTSWFDNLGKYNYGIVHHVKYEDLPTLEEITDTAEDESKEVVQQAPPKAVQIHRPEMVFRSSFRDPKLFAEIHSQNDNMGKFLYNTKVYYPNYRDHLYLPVTTFYGHNNPSTKDLPLFTAHTIIHNQENPSVVEKPPPINPRKHPTVAPRRRPQEPARRPQNVPRKNPPAPPKKLPQEPPKKYIPTKNSVPKKEPPKKLPPPPPKKEEPATEEDYDYDEEDDEDYDDDSTNDKQTDNSDDDYEEESEEEDSNESGERGGKNSYKSRDSDESNESEDQFDKAWSKYGYGKHKNKKHSSSESDEDSYESSESKTEPERIKIYHMKMEVQTTPLKDDDNAEDETSKHDVEAVETPELEEKKKPRKVPVTNQKPHPNAGPDDLKYFQYMNYLGKGEHLAGGRFGNDNHYIEMHERGSEPLGVFQKKVKWADKEGGFGEQYWDLNHG